MSKIKIPKATAKRLPLYYRYLLLLNDEGKDKVSSTELAEAVQVDSASIRRDFSYFGALGKRGYGYDVKNLLSFFKKILNQDTLTNVALVGVGNLGHALLNYNFKRSNNIRISCAFDINPEITGNRGLFSRYRNPCRHRYLRTSISGFVFAERIEAMFLCRCFGVSTSMIIQK